MWRSIFILLAGLTLAGAATAQPEPKRKFGFEAVTAKNGIEVSMVADQGLAAKMTLRPGDRILKVNGKDINTLRDLTTSLESVRTDISLAVIPRQSDKQRTIAGKIEHLDGKWVFTPKRD